MVWVMFTLEREVNLLFVSHMYRFSTHRSSKKSALSRKWMRAYVFVPLWRTKAAQAGFYRERERDSKRRCWLTDVDVNPWRASHQFRNEELICFFRKNGEWNHGFPWISNWLTTSDPSSNRFTTWDLPTFHGPVPWLWPCWVIPGRMISLPGRPRIRRFLLQLGSGRSSPFHHGY